MKKIKRLILFFSAFSLAFTSVVGISNWLIKNDKVQQYEQKSDSEKERVAYIKNGSSSVYYTSIEKAIEIANNNAGVKPVVYVIPGVHYKMNNETNRKKTITINSGVTLSLPFEGESEFSVWKVKNGAFSTDSDAVDAATTVEALLKPETYRTTQITIGRNIQIINKGIINIGGITGSAGGSQVPAGQTCDKFCEVVLEGMNDSVNYQLLNYGTIKNHGKIIGSNRTVLGIENFSNSKLITNFVVRENKGGGALVGLGGGLIDGALNKLKFEVSPFNRIYMPNTMVKMKTNGGANITGNANMFGNNANNQCDVSVVSSSTSSMICIQNASYMISETYIDSLKNTSGDIIVNQYEKMKLDFFGDFSMQYMSMKLTVPNFGTREVKTDTVLFPISYYEEITLNSLGDNVANVSSSQNLKILPGGSLIVNENVSFSIDKLAIYDSFTDNIGWQAHIYPKNLVGGNFEVGGSFAGKKEVGGLISCLSNNASLQIASNSITSKEVKGTPGTSVSDNDYDKISLIANGFISYNDYSMKKQNILGSVSYKGNANNEKYWSATITPSISISDTNNATSVSLNKGESVTIKINELIPDESLFDISTFTWKITKKGTLPSDQTYSKTDGSLNNFVFTVKKMPTWLITWTYDISISGKDIGGNSISCNTYTITLKG